MSPKLKKIRDGLRILDLPSEELMHHERKRIVYIVPVARNYVDYLIGFDEVPDLLIPMAYPPAVTRKIVAWWTRRWALHRASRDNVLSEITEHTLTYPMEHEARVKMPPALSLQGLLFD